MRDFFYTGLLHPADSLKFLFGDKMARNQIISKHSKKRQYTRIAKICATTESVVREYFNEAEADTVCLSTKKVAGSLGRCLGQVGSPEVLYTLCRIIKPLRVVETGVASGLSSAFILEAIRKNRKGRLYSIDMPDYEETLAQYNVKPYYHNSPGILPPGLKTGWIVPEELRSNWTLEIGLTSEKLPIVLDDLKEIDIFLHDSEHTYENMYWEYFTAWKHLGIDGILLSHDVTTYKWNRAFADFAKKVKQKQVIIGELARLKKSQ